MSRKNKEWLKGIQHMAIAKRITLLYGGIFSLSLLFISGFMMLNISGLQQSEMRRELQETMDQKLEREAREFTAKNCPHDIDPYNRGQHRRYREREWRLRNLQY